MINSISQAISAVQSTRNVKALNILIVQLSRQQWRDNGAIKAAVDERRAELTGERYDTAENDTEEYQERRYA
jgi:hypothetical protein